MDEVDEMAEKSDQVATEGTSALFAGLPHEPIDPATYNALCEVVGQAVDTIGGGQVPFTHEDVHEPVEAYPPDTAKALAALSTFFGMIPEGKPYEFEVEKALADNAGVTDLTVLLNGAASDQKLIRAASSPPAAKEKEKAPPAKPKADGFAPKKKEAPADAAPPESKVPPKK